MMIISSTETRQVLRFDREEELFSSLEAYCQSAGITSAWVSAIGAASEVVLSFYNLAGQQYEDYTVTEDLEVVSLTGNIGVLEDELSVHLHGVMSRRDLSTVGGHVTKLVVSASCEVLLSIIDEPLVRGYDETTGLNLLRGL